MEGAFAPWHLIVLLVLFALLFGSKRLPESARALGQSLRIFKAELRDVPGEPATTGSVETVQTTAGER